MTNNNVGSYQFNTGTMGMSPVISSTSSYSRDRSDNNHPVLDERKSVIEAYMLAIPLGIFGAHHLYLGRRGFAVLYMFTFGLLLFGVVFDLVRLPVLVRDVNEEIEHPDRKRNKRIDDAYLLWFCLGAFGAHHFYLHKPHMGMIYITTFGLFGIGLILVRDLYYIPVDVKKANRGIPEDEEKSVVMTFVLSLWVTGFCGGHHFYLRRYFFGFVYLYSLGLCGIGYIIDICRVPSLVRRANKSISTNTTQEKTLDDAYLMWFPFGFLGLHHFYLKRWKWGCLYLFTAGLFAIGWIVDLFRLTYLVERYNRDKCYTPITAPRGQQIHRSPGYTQTAIPSFEQPPPYTSRYGGQRGPMDSEIGHYGTIPQENSSDAVTT